MRPYTILAIETSCDETALAIIRVTGTTRLRIRVLANIVSSQAALHAAWGGVVPNLAKREHQKNLPIILIKALQEANFSIASSQFSIFKKIPNTDRKILNDILEREPELLAQFQERITPLAKPDIDCIAVTQGPGLEPALWVGVNFARALSYVWGVPLIGINHMEGHIASAVLKQSEGISNSQFSISKSKNIEQSPASYKLQTISYPTLALLVSGGHTELVLIKKPLHYNIIGETRDDAAGEAFDKVARILGLGYPGGPVIAREAQQSEVRLPKIIVGSRTSDYLSLPRPMLHTKDFDFSFSGLKTAVLYLVRDLEKQGVNIKKIRPAIAKEFQNAVVDVLTKKTLRAIKDYKARTFILGGGVAANKLLRDRLSQEIEQNFPHTTHYFPSPSLTGDNALMIATAAYMHKLNGSKAKRAKQKTAWKTMRPDANMKLSC